MIPSLGLGIVILSNAAPIGAVEAVGMEFADLVQFGAITRDWLAAYGQLMAPLSAPSGSLVGKTPPEHPTPALPLPAYAGTYHNDYFGDAVVARGGDALALSLGPKQTAYPLRHWDGNVFSYEPSGENATAGSISKVTFTIDAAGRATSLAIEYYEASGWSRFVRR
jgi:hypothetical protein